MALVDNSVKKKWLDSYDTLFELLWEYFSDPDSGYVLPESQSERNWLKYQLEVKMKEVYERKIENLLIPDLNYPYPILKIITETLVKWVKEFVTEFIILTEGEYAKKEAELTVPLALDEIFFDSQIVPERFRNDINSVYTKVKEIIEQHPFHVPESQIIRKKLGNFAIKENDDASNVKNRFPLLAEKYLQLIHQILDDWKSNSKFNQGIIPIDQTVREEVVDKLKDVFQINSPKFENAFWSILVNPEKILPLTLLSIKETLQNSEELKDFYSSSYSRVGLDFLDVLIEDQNHINSSESLRKNIPDKLVRLMKQKSNRSNILQFKAEHIFSKTDLDKCERDLRQYLFLSQSANEDETIEPWARHIISWFDRRMKHEMIKRARQLYQRHYISHYFSSYAQLMDYEINEQLVKSKPKDLRQYKSFKTAVQRSKKFMGHNNENILMPIDQTYRIYEFLREAIQKFFTTANGNLDDAKKNLKKDLMEIPTHIFLRFSRTIKRPIHFDLKLFKESVIHRLGEITRNRLHRHLGGNEFQVQKGVPIAEIPNAFQHRSIIKGIVNLLKSEAHPIYEYSQSAVDTFKIKSVLPENYPSDSAGVLRMFCNYSKEVYGQVSSYYGELFSRLKYPQQADFFKPIEKKLHTLTSVVHVGCHGDLNGGNMLSQPKEELAALDRQGEAATINTIDGENFFIGPSGLGLAFLLGRNPLTREQKKNIFTLWVKEMPKKYTGGVKNAERDMKVYLGFEMIKSAMIDAIRCQQALMQEDIESKDQLTPEIKKRLDAALPKIKHAFTLWHLSGLDVPSTIEEDDFLEILIKFNQKKKKEVFTLVKKAQDDWACSILTNREIDQLIDSINYYRMYWNGDANFPKNRQGQQMIRNILAQQLTPDQILEQTVKLSIYNTEQREIQTEDQNRQRPQNLAERLANLAHLDAPGKRRMPGNIGREQPQFLISKDLFDKLLTPSQHEHHHEPDEPLYVVTEPSYQARER